jgi:hypothetical protein
MHGETVKEKSSNSNIQLSLESKIAVCTIGKQLFREMMAKKKTN